MLARRLGNVGIDRLGSDPGSTTYWEETSDKWLDL